MKYQKIYQKINKKSNKKSNKKYNKKFNNKKIIKKINNFQNIHQNKKMIGNLKYKVPQNFLSYVYYHRTTLLNFKKLIFQMKMINKQMIIDKL